MFKAGTITESCGGRPVEVWPSLRRTGSGLIPAIPRDLGNDLVRPKCCSTDRRVGHHQYQRAARSKRPPGSRQKLSHLRRPALAGLGGCPPIIGGPTA